MKEVALRVDAELVFGGEELHDRGCNLSLKMQLSTHLKIELIDSFQLNKLIAKDEYYDF